jgi:tRNA pseudouridine38-40 synthase
MPNYALTLSYDGTRYRGWQRQGNTGSTIQEKIETALSRLLDEPIEAAGSGRTDAGVHARRQLCSFRTKTAIDCEETLRELRQVLPEDIGALALEEAAPRFHARLSCVGKTYCYRVRTTDTPEVFTRRYVLPCLGQLDLDAMKKAADALCGEHDFSAFCSLKNSKKSNVRRLESVTFSEADGELRIFFTGDGFLYNMVRILTGTLLEVGLGKRAPEEMGAILASRERAQAGPTAPALGLTLWEVFF